MLRKAFAAFTLVLVTALVNAATFSHSKTDFIQAALGEVPKAQVLWLTKQDKQIIANILQHPVKQLRVRYWRKAQKSVWVLNELGKEQPITVGVVVDDNEISQLTVLAYRESRGGEVAQPFFTEQFKSAKLAENNRLSQQIDGITGATLSVRALTKVAKLALYLSQKIAKNS